MGKGKLSLPLKLTLFQKRSLHPTFTPANRRGDFLFGLGRVSCPRKANVKTRSAENSQPLRAKLSIYENTSAFEEPRSPAGIWKITLLNLFFLSTFPVKDA